MDPQDDPQATTESPEFRELAASLDCFTEAEVRALGRITEITLEAWRKRGKGPAYIVFGRTILYPRKAVAEHLATLVRERKPAGLRGSI